MDDCAINFNNVTKQFNLQGEKTFKELLPSLIMGNSWSKKLTVFSNISFQIKVGETVGIVGSGLGLYVTKSLVELMNGQIEVESTEWHGSRFIVMFPVAKEVK